MKKDLKEFSLKLLNGLSERANDVISRRFALFEGKPLKKESLESIGKDYKVCRERIRQIEVKAIKHIKENIEKKENLEPFQEIEQEAVDYLKKNGGVKKEDVFLTFLAPNQENFLNFLLNFSNKVKKFSKDNELHAFFYLEENLKDCKETINFVIKELEMAKKPLEPAELTKNLKKEKNISLETNQFLSILDVSKKIGKTINGKIGLTSWPEVKPKTVKDKINLILKTTERPLHFKEITDLINKFNQALGENKSPNVQTVHNELIRNENFVLIGRGIYALKEWGYERGQVKDVILKVLETYPSLSRDEILKEVLKQRMVKKSTVFLNLQNKKLFLKDNSGKYKIRQA